MLLLERYMAELWESARPEGKLADSELRICRHLEMRRTPAAILSPITRPQVCVTIQVPFGSFKKYEALIRIY